MIRIDETRCKGCGLCVEACPTGALRLVGGVARVEQSLCRECEACLRACPTGAISVVQEPVEVIQPAPLRVPPPAPAVARPTGRFLPWVGAALAFVGREVVPRAVAALLDAWDRRQARFTQVAPSSVGRPRTTAGRLPPVTDAGAGRHRRRFRHRGRR